MCEIEGEIKKNKEFIEAENLEDASVASCLYVIQQRQVELVPDNVIKEEEVYRRSNSW
jgi:hypothetical protein